jgi:hypothetical protein
LINDESVIISNNAERLARLEDMLQALQRQKAKTAARIIAVVPEVTLAPVVAGSWLPARLRWHCGKPPSVQI